MKQALFALLATTALSVRLLCSSDTPASSAVVATFQKQAVTVQAFHVETDFLAPLRVNPVLGRKFISDDFKSGSAAVVAVSHEFWKEVLGRRPAVIGAVLRIGENPHTIVAVLPADPKLPKGRYLWIARRAEK
jgi:hypothetical protein